MINRFHHRPHSIAPALLRQGFKLFQDTALALGCLEIAILVFRPPQPQGLRAFGAWGLLAALTSFALGLPRQHFRLTGFQDALRVGLAFPFLALGGLLLLLLRGAPLINHGPLLLGASLLTTLAWLAVRWGARAVEEGRNQVGGPHYTHLQERTLVLGAGRAGLLVAQELRRHPDLGQVVGFLDDANDKQGMYIQGIQVLGSLEHLPAIVHRHRISQVIIAIPSAPGSILRKVSEIAQGEGLTLKTVPGIYDLLGPQNWRPELRDVSIEDLLRREAIQLDQSGLRDVLEEAVVLITGGGGSIGGELAQQVATFRPNRIVLLGRGENSLWETECRIREAFPNQPVMVELCDVRNVARLEQVFARWKPHVVFHAAAHKHVPYLETNPEEAVENNILGTLRVVEASLAHGVHTFVNISTDKAVNPTNVLGATKRIAEMAVVQGSSLAQPWQRFVSVRFGNVLGSRGSVIPLFRNQLKRGGPLTVTHPEMTRYFMTIPEASQLVLQAGILGQTGKVYVLDMGDPVRIVDLAKDMIRLSDLVPDQDIEIIYTGIRPGEKLFEELFSDQEQTQTAIHPKVLEGHPDCIDPELLTRGIEALASAARLPDGARHRTILEWLQRLVPSYTPSPTGLGRFQPGVDDRISGAHKALRIIPEPK